MKTTTGRQQTNKKKRLPLLSSSGQPDFIALLNSLFFIHTTWIRHKARLYEGIYSGLIFWSRNICTTLWNNQLNMSCRCHQSFTKAGSPLTSRWSNGAWKLLSCKTKEIFKARVLSNSNLLAPSQKLALWDVCYCGEQCKSLPAWRANIA